MKKLLIYNSMVVLFFLAVTQALGFTVSNDSYSVSGSIDMTGPKPTPTPLSTTHLIYLSPSPLPSSQYTITTPKGDGSDLDFLRISLDNQMIDYGPLSPSNPIVRTAVIASSPGKSFGYAVVISEDTPLTNITNQTIPDTTCDQGACSDEVASIWENALTFGLGYRCDSDSVSCIGFGNGNLYKHFSQANKKYPIDIYYGNRYQSVSAILTYRLNIQAAQPGGSYSNRVSILALPFF